MAQTELRCFSFLVVNWTFPYILQEISEKIEKEN